MVCGPLLTRRKYKRLVKEVFGSDVERSERNEAEMERLTVYALTNPKMLPKIGLYVERRAGKKFSRKEYAQVCVAVHIINQLVQACHLDLRLFADSVVRLIKFLLRQVEAPDLQPIGCEMLIKFANHNQDEASQIHTLTPFVDDLVRLCHDSQSRPDLRQSIREAGLRTMVTLVQLVDGAGLAEQFGKLMPGVLVNMNVAPTADVSNDMDRRVRDTAFRLFGDICRTLRPTLAPFILKPLFAYLDGNNCWANGGESSSFVLESLQHLMQNMLPQHNYLIFIHMHARIEACCRQGADPNITLCTVRAVSMLAEHARATPGPAFFKMFVCILDVMLVSLGALNAAGYDGKENGDEDAAELSPHEKLALLQQAIKDAATPTHRRGGEVEVVRKVAHESVDCMSKIAEKLYTLPQHLDALHEIAARCIPNDAVQIAAGDGGGAKAAGDGGRVKEQDANTKSCTHTHTLTLTSGDCVDLSFLEVGWGREWILRALKAVTHEGVRLSTGKTLPRDLVLLLLSWATASSPFPPTSTYTASLAVAAANTAAGRTNGARVRELVAQLLGDLLCGWPPNDDDARHRAWNERLAVHELAELSRAVLHMVCEETNTSAVNVHVHRLLVRLARSGPQAWVEVFLPHLLVLQRLALRDTLESQSLETLALPTTGDPETAFSCTNTDKDAHDAENAGSTAQQTSGVVVLQGGTGQLESERRRGGRGGKWNGSTRSVLDAAVRARLQTMVAGCVLAVSLALPCPELEAHVRQVVMERRQAGHDSSLLRIAENGDLELVQALQGSEQTSSGDGAQCIHVLDVTEMVHALAPAYPHLARVLAAHGAGEEDRHTHTQEPAPLAATLVRSGSIMSTLDNPESGGGGFGISRAAAPRSLPNRSLGSQVVDADHDVAVDDVLGVGGVGFDGNVEAMSVSDLSFHSLSPKERLETFRFLLPDLLHSPAEASDVSLASQPPQISAYCTLHPARLIRDALRSSDGDASGLGGGGSDTRAGGAEGHAKERDEVTPTSQEAETLYSLRKASKKRFKTVRALASAVRGAESPATLRSFGQHWKTHAGGGATSSKHINAATPVPSSSKYYIDHSSAPSQRSAAKNSKVGIATPATPSDLSNDWTISRWSADGARAPKADKEEEEEMTKRLTWFSGHDHFHKPTSTLEV